MNERVCRVIIGAGMWTIFAMFMAVNAPARVLAALLVGTIGVFGVCAWRLLSAPKQEPEVHSGARDAAEQQLRRRGL